MYLRFQSTVPNARGRLTAEHERFRQVNNAWYEANVTDPATVDATVYDRSVNPAAAAWFKRSAGEPLRRVAGYLRILAEHGVGCELVRSPDPGRVVYEDEHQIVVVPHD